MHHNMIYNYKNGKNNYTLYSTYHEIQCNHSIILAVFPKIIALDKITNVHHVDKSNGQFFFVFF